MRANERKSRKIFHLSNGTIRIYDFNQNYSSLILFRQEEMKKIPLEEQILFREANRFLFKHREKIFFECDAYNLRIKPAKNMDEVEDYYNYVRHYILGLYEDASVHVRERSGSNGEIFFYINPKVSESNKKIQITEPLYLAYLLENERFDAPALQASDLSDLQHLFTISDQPIAECSMDSLEVLLNSGLVRGDYNKKAQLLEGSTKVYEKLKGNK